MGTNKAAGIRRAVTAGALGVAALVAAPAAASAATTGGAATTSGSAPTIRSTAAGAWPSQVAGRPDFGAGSAAGYYAWHDRWGWHLEVTHAGHAHDVFSGYVTTDGTFRVRRVDDERNNVVRVGPQRHVMSFAFNNYGHLDGVHFRSDGGTKLEFHLSIDGHPVPATAVSLGRDAIHPTGNPFAVVRTQL